MHLCICIILGYMHMYTYTHACGLHAARKFRVRTIRNQKRCQHHPNDKRCLNQLPQTRALIQRDTNTKQDNPSTLYTHITKKNSVDHHGDIFISMLAAMTAGSSPPTSAPSSPSSSASATLNSVEAFCGALSASCCGTVSRACGCAVVCRGAADAPLCWLPGCPWPAACVASVHGAMSSW